MLLVFVKLRDKLTYQSLTIQQCIIKDLTKYFHIHYILEERQAHQFFSVNFLLLFVFSF